VLRRSQPAYSDGLNLKMYYTARAP